MRGLERSEAAGDSGPACGGITGPSEGIQKAGSGVQKATGGEGTRAELPLCGGWLERKKSWWKVSRR